VSEKDPTEKLKETENYLQTWMDHFREASQAAPFVQESLEEVSWARRALEDRPPESNNVSRELVADWAETAHNNLIAVLPPIPSFGNTSGFQVSSSTASSNSAVVRYIYEVGQIGTPAAKEYFENKFESYRTLQDQHDRPQRVREMISRRWPGCLDRFDAAFEVQRRFKAKLITEDAAAIAIRTALEGIKGEIFQEVRRNTRENMTWAEMARRLCRNSSHQDLLLKQEAAYNTIHGHLSKLAKKRPAGQIPSIEVIWTFFLDHLLVMLT
jgi:hypothetical protein